MSSLKELNMNTISKIKSWFQNPTENKYLSQWKEAFSLRRDYEVMSGIASYLMEEIKNNENLTEDDLRIFLYGSKDDVLKNDLLKGIKVDLYDYLPDTLGELIEGVSNKDFEELRDFAVARHHGKIDLSKLKFVAFSGVGAKGFAYEGVLQAFSMIYDKKTNLSLFDQIEEVSGTSAGSLLGLPYALGYDVNKIEDIVLKNNFGRFFDDSNLRKDSLFYKVIGKFIGMSNQDRAELEYLNAYSSIVYDNLIEHVYSVIYSDGRKNKNENDDLKQERLDAIKSDISTMPFADIKSLCLHIIKSDEENRRKNIELGKDPSEIKDLIQSWRNRAVAATKAVEIKYNSDPKEKKVKGFEDYGTHLDVLIFCIRRANNEDKIQAFLEDLVEARVNKIPKRILEKVLPSVTIEADRMLIENIKTILCAAAVEEFDLIESETGFKKGTIQWRERLVRKLRETKSSNDCCSKGSCHAAFDEASPISGLEVDVAIDAISKMAPHEVLRVGKEAKKSREMFGNIRGSITFNLRKCIFEKQRVLYKRKLNFYELNILAEKLPQYGFKKLHVAMSEVQRSLTKPLKLADASAENPEFARMPLSQAVRQSMNLPVGFKTIKYRDRKFIDGVMVANLPNHFYLKNMAKKEFSTLNCLLADDEFYLKHNTFKKALSSGLSKVLYFLNPNYRRISHEDLMRSIIVRSGDVGVGQFGVDKVTKAKMIKRARKDAYECLMSGEDVQLRYLKDRLEILKGRMDDEATKEARKFAVENERVNIAPGIFSKGEMAKLHRSLRPDSQDLDEMKARICQKQRGSMDPKSIKAKQAGYGY